MAQSFSRHRHVAFFNDASPGVTLDTPGGSPACVLLRGSKTLVNAVTISSLSSTSLRRGCTRVTSVRGLSNRRERDHPCRIYADQHVLRPHRSRVFIPRLAYASGFIREMLKVFLFFYHYALSNAFQDDTAYVIIIICRLRNFRVSSTLSVVSARSHPSYSFGVLYISVCLFVCVCLSV